VRLFFCPARQDENRDTQYKTIFGRIPDAGRARPTEGDRDNNVNIAALFCDFVARNPVHN
jgi:hypothetical protein